MTGTVYGYPQWSINCSVCWGTTITTKTCGSIADNRNDVSGGFEDLANPMTVSTGNKEISVLIYCNRFWVV